MKTMYGPEAKQGDYVVVCNVSGTPTAYTARVFDGKAYTGYQIGRGYEKYLHRTEVITVIPESYVSAANKHWIDKDIALELCKKIGNKEGSFFVEKNALSGSVNYCIATKTDTYRVGTAEGLLLLWYPKLKADDATDWTSAIEFIEERIVPKEGILTNWSITSNDSICYEAAQH